MARLDLGGTSVSPGVGVGRVEVAHEATLRRIPRLTLDGASREDALERLDAARLGAIAELERIQAATTRELGIQDAAIYGAQIAVLHDPDAHKTLSRLVLDEDLRPISAVQALIDQFETLFENLEGGDRKNWAADLRDPWMAVVRHLQDISAHEQDEASSKPRILVAEELTPSLVSRHHKRPVAGILCTRGGRFSHGAVLARSFGIPAVTGIENVHIKAHPGESALVFGDEGRALLGADARQLRRAKQRSKEQARVRDSLQRAAQDPCFTADGEAMDIMVNIESPRDLEDFDAQTVAGVGLFRTEFAYMERPSFPSVQEQAEVYRSVLDRFPDKPVVFRTLDIGGDKQLRYLEHPAEKNPVLGWRGLRFSLEWQDLFLLQVSAIARTRESGDARILLPMVTTLEEVRQAKELVVRACGAADPPPLGIMIEVPAAALALRDLAEEVDFVSIGTNDLTQYLFAVDRDNPWVSNLYQPYHPAHLRVLRSMVRTCRSVGKPVSVCGEMASHQPGALFLLGAGFRQLSLASPFVAEMKAFLRQISSQEARKWANQAAQGGTAAEALATLEEPSRAAWKLVMEHAFSG